MTLVINARKTALRYLVTMHAPRHAMPPAPRPGMPRAVPLLALLVVLLASIRGGGAAAEVAVACAPEPDMTLALGSGVVVVLLGTRIPDDAGRAP